MRSFFFEISEGDFLATVTVTEIELDDGSVALSFTIEVIGDEYNSGDIRALFFNLQPFITDGSLVITGTDVSQTQFDEQSISDLGHGASIKGSVLKNFGPFDVGVEFGSSGAGVDNIQSTNFILTSADGSDLHLEDVALQNFGLRVTGIGDEGEGVKVGAIAPEAPDDVVGGQENDNLIGTPGDDDIYGYGGDDILLGGLGLDNIYAGSGNDHIVVVGQTSENEYSEQDILNSGGSGVDLSPVLSLDSLNAQGISQAKEGETINGGPGYDFLHIYGDVDLSLIDLDGIEEIVLNSDVILNVSELSSPGWDGEVSWISGGNNTSLSQNVPDNDGDNLHTVTIINDLDDYGSDRFIFTSAVVIRGIDELTLDDGLVLHFMSATDLLNFLERNPDIVIEGELYVQNDLSELDFYQLRTAGVFSDYDVTFDLENWDWGFDESYSIPDEALNSSAHIEMQDHTLKILAEFSLAAYHLAGWEPTGEDFNSENLQASDLYNQLKLDGWYMMELADISLGDAQTQTSQSSGYSFALEGGIYTNENAGALIAVSGSTLILSFRGTNDDSDRSQWIDFDSHFELFAPLFNLLFDPEKGFVTTAGITEVYVSGHSLGAGMVEAFMRDHSDVDFPGTSFNAITFASPGYPTPYGGLFGDEYDDPRQIDLRNDGDLIIAGELVGERSGHIVTLGSFLDPSILDLATHSMSMYLAQASYFDYLGIKSSDLLDWGIDQTRLDLQFNEGSDIWYVNPNGYGIYPIGGNDNDLVLGGHGEDDLYSQPGSGEDYFYGGPGGDTFHFNSGASSNQTLVVADFSPWQGDKILIAELTSFEQILASASNQNGDVYINVGGIYTIVIKETSISDLKPQHFGYPPVITWNIIEGDNGPDYLYGTDGMDKIYGYGNIDWLWGYGGDDILYGGTGYYNVLYGGDGNDELYSESEWSYFFGEDGDDTAYASSNGFSVFFDGPGSDTYYGTFGLSTLRFLDFEEDNGQSNVGIWLDLDNNEFRDPYGDHNDIYDVDEVWGTFDDDYMSGTNNDLEIFRGLGGRDDIYGGGGDDWLVGGEGNDDLYGEGGNDKLYGGSDNDDLYGGSGNDWIFDGPGIDRVYGGSGVDTLLLDGSVFVYTDEAAPQSGAYVNLAENTFVDGYGYSNSVSSIENVRGTNEGDYIYGDNDENFLFGNDGDDLLVGGGGVDDLLGGEGDDILVGGSQYDYLVGDDQYGIITDDDIFVFDVGQGHGGYIKYFDDGDTLFLENAGILGGIWDLEITYSGDSATIQYGNGGSIYIEHVFGTLDAGDILITSYDYEF